MQKEPMLIDSRLFCVISQLSLFSILVFGAIRHKAF